MYGYNMYSPVASSYMQGMGGMSQQTQPVNGLTRVTGIEGARAYQLPPNSVVALFDSNSDTMFIKRTDGAGYPTIDTYSFTRVVDVQPNQEFVTRKEFNELKEMIASGKQLVSTSTEPVASSSTGQADANG